VSNPGFEASLAGWKTGASRTTLTRSCTIAHTGSCAAELGRTRSSGDATLDDSPNTVSSTAAGATYTGSAWVRAPAGRAVTLRVRELSGSSLVRSALITTTGDGGWHQLVVATAAAAGGTSLSVEIVASLTTSGKAQVDDVSLHRN
jgi:hypothetical protein